MKGYTVRKYRVRQEAISIENLFCEGIIKKR